MSNAIPAGQPFEEILAELEAVVRDLEDGQLGLDQAVARYERGIALIRHCHGHLQAAEQRILQLTGVDADGQPVLQPFRHESTVRSASFARRRPADG